MVIGWAYGIFIGLLKGNQHSFVFRNFVGMAFYVIYFVLINYNIRKETVVKILFYSIVIVLVESMLYRFAIFGGVPAVLFIREILGKYNGGSSTGQLRIYFIPQVVLYVAVSTFFFFLLKKKQFLTNIEPGIKSFFGRLSSLKVSIIIILSIYNIVFLTASKGFMLGFFGLLSIIFLDYILI